MDGQNLVPLPGELLVESAELALLRAPEVLLEEAGRAAKALQDVVTKTKASMKIGESEHLKSEAWQTLGHFYGFTARIRETRFVQYGTAQGFEAIADLYDMRTGKMVSSAEAMCMNDEEKWSTRPKYQRAYICKDGQLSLEDPGSDAIVWEDNPYKPGKKRPKMQRVEIGEERVPLYQLKSMAETRAVSKVHSIVLRWVVVLAGYAPTPAEEMVEDPEDDYGTPPAAPSQQATRAPQAREENKASAGGHGEGNPALISKAQVSKLWATGYAGSKEYPSLEQQQIKNIVYACGYDDMEMIPKVDFDRVLESVRTRDAISREAWQNAVKK